MDLVDIEKIKMKLKDDFTYWYHKIDLGNGITTPGFEYDVLWDNIRKVREGIDYKDKLVLDIATFDGLWAFEAENLGAKSVIATDCLYRSYRNFLFCKEILKSKCIPYYNISPYNLFDRLDVFFQENYDDEKEYDRLFDIVHHLGLLYHLRDPFLSLSQARSCLKTDGLLLIETNIITDTEESYMLYNGIPDTYRISENYSVWWVPTISCLKEMLTATFFEPNEDSISIVKFELPLLGRNINTRKKPSGKEHEIGRLCMIAKARDPKEFNPEFTREMFRSYRNPGISPRIR